MNNKENQSYRIPVVIPPGVKHVPEIDEDDPAVDFAFDESNPAVQRLIKRLGREKVRALDPRLVDKDKKGGR